MYRHLSCGFRLLSLLLCCLVFFGCSAHGARPEGAKAPTATTTGDSVPVGRPTGGKRVALSYDDGPHAVQTVRIVDELNKYGFHATFFVVGNRVDGTEYNGADALAYAVTAGNEIAIHGYTHRVTYDSCSEDVFRQEMNKTEQAIREVVPGYQGKLMRPVEGKITPQRVATCPYSVMMWSVDSEDWCNKYYPGIPDEEADRRVNTTVENVMKEVSEGDIILMHDIYESTYDATVLLLARLAEEGYEVVTVSELMGDLLKPGTRYYSLPVAVG